MYVRLIWFDEEVLPQDWASAFPVLRKQISPIKNECISIVILMFK